MALAWMHYYFIDGPCIWRAIAPDHHGSCPTFRYRQENALSPLPVGFAMTANPSL